MDVLDADELDERLVSGVVVVGRLGDLRKGVFRRQLVDPDAALDPADLRVHAFQDREVETLLRPEVVVDHPLRRPRSRSDLIDPAPAKPMTEFGSNDVEDVFR